MSIESFKILDTYTQITFSKVFFQSVYTFVSSGCILIPPSLALSIKFFKCLQFLINKHYFPLKFYFLYFFNYITLNTYTHNSVIGIINIIFILRFVFNVYCELIYRNSKFLCWQLVFL